MAIDEHECSKCQAITLRRRPINDKPVPVAKCGECGNNATYIVSIPGYRRDHTVCES